MGFRMNPPSDRRYVSRGGEKLAAALDHFGIDVGGRTCADLGSHIGGFVDCLLRRGATRVYSVDTSYGTLAWKLRKAPRVVVLERTNAMHVVTAELCQFVTIDVAWTRQSKVLPQAARIITDGATVLTLIKPHYEGGVGILKDGVLPDELVDGVVADVLEQIEAGGWRVLATVASVIRGRGGNQEVFAWVERSGPIDTHAG